MEDREIIRDFNRLLAAATDAEADIIRDVARKALILWDCTSCGDYCTDDMTVCPNCGTAHIRPFIVKMTVRVFAQDQEHAHVALRDFIAGGTDEHDNIDLTSVCIHVK